MAFLGAMTRMTVATLCGAALVGVSAPPVAAERGRRGELVSVSPVATMDVEQVAGYLTRFGLDDSRARFAVEMNRIVYRTIDPHGRPTTASALVAVPGNDDRTPRHVTWLHGTTAYRGSVASIRDGNDRAAALLFASAGFLTTAPDYLGIGVGPGVHPYMHARSTVTASVDALRATRELAGREGMRPDRRVLVTGHSQGGHATMALGMALQRGVDPRLGLGALAPISGPLHVSEALADALAGHIDNGVAYLAYWTVAWNRLYHLYDSPAEAFFDPSIEALFDGDHENEDIFPRLPATVPELFKPDFLARLRQPTGALRAALREADGFCDWRPRVPVRLYASGGDREVLIENSTYCAERLENHHAEADVIDLGPTVGHAEAADLALPRILAEFESR